MKLEVHLARTHTNDPEEYDAYIKVLKFGYLCLRDGEFIVSYPDKRGKVVYMAEPKGRGMFHEDEREFYLEAAKEALLKWHHRKRYLE